MMGSNSVPPKLDELNAAFEAGVYPALLEAIQLCLKCDIAAPEWVLAASYSLIVRALHGPLIDGKGRAASPLRRYKDDMIHFARWETANAIRAERQARLEHIRKNLECSPGTTQAKRRLLADTSESCGWDYVYRATADILFGTDAFGEPDTIKESCKKVSAMMKEPLKARRFLRVQADIMRELEVFPGIVSGGTMGGIPSP